MPENAVPSPASSQKKSDHSTQKTAAPSEAKPSLSTASLQPGAPEDVLSLQRLYGNRAVSKFIQASRDHPSASHYEREADHAADKLLKKTSESTKGISLSPVTRADSGFPADPSLTHRLNSLRGSGSPLPVGLRKSVEPHLGADLSPVRVHTDSEAKHLNQQIQARAFTYGSDIYLGKKDSPSNQRLMTHELAHVVQQNGGKSEPTVQAFGGKFAKFFGIGKKKENKPPSASSDGPKPEEAEHPREAQPATAQVKDDKPEEKATPESKNPYSVTSMGIRPDFADQELAEQTPNQFVLTIAVARERADNLKFSKVRLHSSIRNQARSFAKKALGKRLGKMIRAPKTKDEIKHKAARKVYEQKTGFEKAKDLVGARKEDMLPENYDELKGSARDDAMKQAAISYLESQSSQVGHTWVKLSTRVGGKTQELSSFGFWPKKWTDASGDTHGGYGHPNKPVPGMVMHPDLEHDEGSGEQTRFKDVQVKADKYQSALKLAVDRFKSPPQYVLASYNCTKFAKEIATAAGAAFPGQPIVPGWYANLLNTLTRAPKGSERRLHASLTPGGAFEGMDNDKDVYTQTNTPEGVEQPDLYLPDEGLSQYDMHRLGPIRRQQSAPPLEPEPEYLDWTIDLSTATGAVIVMDETETSPVEFLNNSSGIVKFTVCQAGFPQKYTETDDKAVDVMYKGKRAKIAAGPLIKYKQQASDSQPQPESSAQAETGPKGWSMDLTRTPQTVIFYDQSGEHPLDMLREEVIDLKVLDEKFPEGFDENSTKNVLVEYKGQKGVIAAKDLLKFKKS